VLERSRPSIRIFFLVVFLLQLASLVPVSRLRFIDGDEGFYLMTSRLVVMGRLPYHDFLLTQTPLVPYAYGSWMQIAGSTWLSARLLSAILAAILGAALSCEVLRHSGRVTAGIAAALIYVSSTLVVVWFTTVKTYALSALLLFTAYSITVRRPASAWAWILAGVCLGGSADARLYFGALLPVFLWWICRQHSPDRRRAAVAAFVAGFVISLAPNIYLALRDPRTWYFDNLGFHAIRSNSGLVGGFASKLLIASWLFLAQGDGNGPQMLLLTYGTVLAWRNTKPSPAMKLALSIALVLGVICLLPTPPFVQYFCVIVPFLIVFVCAGLADWSGRARRRSLACIGGVVLFVGLAIGPLQRFLLTGQQVAGVLDPAVAADWRISSVTAVSRAVDARIHPGEQVLSLWPGYLFQSQAMPFPGLENNAGTYLAGRLSPEQQATFHILSPTGIIQDITARRPRLVVLGNYKYALPQDPPFRESLVRAGYKLDWQLGDTTLWMR
jgi:hypothetical protein